MLRGLCATIVLPFLSSVAIGQNPFRTTAFSEPEYCRLLESSAERIRLLFEWPRPDSDYPPEEVYLAVPFSGEREFTYDRWCVEIGPAQGDRTVIAGDSQSASDENLKQIQDILNQAGETTGRTEFFFHEVRVVKVVINPNFLARVSNTQYAGKRIFIRELELTIRFVNSARSLLPPQSEQSFPGGFPSLYRHLLLNHESVNLYRTRPDNVPPPLEAGWSGSIGIPQAGLGERVRRENAVKLLTRGDGLYAVGMKDIEKVGLSPAAIDLSTLSLWSQGKSCAFLTTNAKDNRFGPDTRIVFRARRTDSPYTRDTVFWLVWGDTDLPQLAASPGVLEGTGDAILVRSVTDTLYFEEDHQLGRKTHQDYEWFWAALGQEYEVPLHAPGRSADSPVHFSVRLFNRERVPQTVTLKAGGSESVETIQPDREDIFGLVIAASDAISSTTVGIFLPQATPNQEPSTPLHTKTDDIRRVFLAAYQIQYQRDLTLRYGAFSFVSPATGVPMRLPVADCTETVQPMLLAETPNGNFIDWTGTAEHRENLVSFIATATGGMEFHLFDPRDLPVPESVVRDNATTLHAPDNSADVLVISHAMFIDPVLDSWLEWRNRQGYRVQVVDVQDIYDEWSFGQPSCRSIKDFLGYTLCAWTPPLPQYVVLIGDCSWDHRDNYQTGIADLLPTYVPENTPEHYASDVWYALIYGGQDDTLPEMLLSRISVRSTPELANVIEKVLLVEQNPEVGPWRARNVFISDDTYERDARETEEISIPAQLENVYINQIDFPLVTSPYLYHLYEMEEKYCPACTDAIIRAFDEGGILFQYFGHGGNQMWSHERIFMGTDRKLSEVLLLQEHGRLPLLVNWSCLTGYVNFNFPPFHVCLSEELVRQPRKGAIAVWSPSDMGSTEQHQIMAHYLSRNIFTEHRTIVGDAIEAARLDYSLVSKVNELLRQYISFGDPLTRLSLPTYETSLEFIPERVRHGETVSLTVRGKGPSEFTGTGTLAVTMAPGRELATARDISVVSGEFSHAVTFTVPEEGERLKVRFYAQSQDGTTDFWGGRTLETALPNLALEQLSITPKNAAQGTARSVRWVVTNRSPIDSPATECRVWAGPLIEIVQVPALPSGTTKELLWMGTLSHTAMLEVFVDPTGQVRESNKEDNRAATEWVIDSTPAVFPITRDINLVPSFPSEGTETKISIPFAARTESATASVAARLVGLPSGTEQITFVIDRDQRLRQVWTWPNVPAGDHRLPLVAAIDDLPQATVAVIPVLVSEKPDLAFTPGTLQYEPAHPILGQSIFLTTRLYNIGHAPAYNVQIAAYDGPKDDNNTIKRFQNKTYISPEPISTIGAGDGVDIRLRWDMPGFAGLGAHDVTIVADPKGAIPEIDETNNEDQVHLTIHDLPHLTVDPWDGVQYLIPPGEAQWGQAIPIRAEGYNRGESPAERVRMSLLFNGEEYSYIFPRVEPGARFETATALPSRSGKNVLEVQLDRYDLIAEKGETDKGIGDNLSKPHYLYLDMVMPQAAVENNRLLYHVQDETEYSAGVHEYTGWVPDRGIGIKGDLDEHNIELRPTYVSDMSPVSTVRVPKNWWWQKEHDCFTTPAEGNRDLEFSVPAPNGRYDVFIEMFSSGWVNQATAVFSVRCKNDAEFHSVECLYSGEGYCFQPLGSYHIVEDRFSFILRPVTGSAPVSFYKVKFKRPSDGGPVAAGYSSALFPAGPFERKRVQLSWDAEIPEGTDLGVRARWCDRDEQGGLRHMPWMRFVPGAQGNLNIAGKGDYVQFYGLFARHRHDSATSTIRSVTIEIEPE